MSTSVSLGKHFERFVAEQLKSGRYNNTSEIIRDALRRLEDEVKLQALKERELADALEAGRNSPDVGSTEEVVARGKARLKNKKRARR